MASKSSAVPEVREKLLSLQRELARRQNVVMDGRDIGTCVLPDADVKVYLTASSRTRAKRRYDELTARGVPCDLEQIEQGHHRAGQPGYEPRDRRLCGRLRTRCWWTART